MKIYVLPVAQEFRPTWTAFRSPEHGADWDVERDMARWLSRHPDFVTADPAEADWDYFGPHWNKYYIQSWGQDGLDEMQAEILRLVSRNRPTFTVCEYDVKLMQPFYDLCGMEVFCGSRQDDRSGSIDIPLLCAAHEMPWLRPERKYLASFMGNYGTVSPRLELAEMLAGREDVSWQPGDQGERAFVDLILSSYIALAPRGHGGQSFRFYEAMQLGVVPLLIGEPDTRPFKSWVDWEWCSLYARTADEAVAILDNPPEREELLAMGAEAARVWRDLLQYGQWCWFVAEELRAR